MNTTKNFRFRFLYLTLFYSIYRVNSLLPRTMFISVVHSLLSHSIPSIRRRAMELLSAKLQHQSNFFSLAKDEGVLMKLIPSLTSIANSQGSNEEAVLNQQTAFFTLKLLCRFMGPTVSSSFRPVFDVGCGNQTGPENWRRRRGVGNSQNLRTPSVRIPIRAERRDSRILPESRIFVHPGKELPTPRMRQHKQKQKSR